MSVTTRRRLVAALGVVVLGVVLVTLAVPNLPCSFPGGDSCPPPDDAQDLVPGDALAYLHANLDPEEEDWQRATEVGDKLPLISRQVIDRALAALPGPAGGSLDFDEDVRPWFGGEAAIAILPGDRHPERVVLLEVDDSDGADDFAGEVGVGVGSTVEHEGVELSVGPGGVATAQTHGFLLIGARPGVEEVVDTAAGAGGAEPLADDDAATAARDELPEHRFAEVYLSADGVDELVSRARGTLGTLSPLLAPGSTRGAAASLTATEDSGLELAVRSVLDPDKSRTAPGFFAAFPRFEPSLPERLGGDSLAYLGLGEPRTAVGALLAQASSEAPGVAAGFRGLVDRLRESGVDIERDLLDSLGGEAAFALAPGSGEGGPAFPLLQFVAAGVDEDEAKRALAALQVPLAKSVNPGSAGQAPVFSEQQVDGVEVHSLQMSPTVELTYAVFDGLVAIATGPAGVEQLVSDQGSGLDDSDRYEQATQDFPGEVSLIAYLDLRELVALGEQLGLAEDPLYATFAGEFRRLDALGLQVTAEDDLLSTDARLLLGEGDAGEGSTDTGPSSSD